MTPSSDRHYQSWPNVASAILASLYEIEDPETLDEVGVAFPDTHAYRHRMSPLMGFCNKQRIAVYLVSKDGQVRQA